MVPAGSRLAGIPHSPHNGWVRHGRTVGRSVGRLSSLAGATGIALMVYCFTYRSQVSAQSVRLVWLSTMATTPVNPSLPEQRLSRELFEEYLSQTPDTTPTKQFTKLSTKHHQAKTTKKEGRVLCREKVDVHEGFVISNEIKGLPSILADLYPQIIKIRGTNSPIFKTCLELFI
jgi:hypothetical protein